MIDLTKLNVNRVDTLPSVIANMLSNEMITNNITEISQDIKLEIIDGTLILKAGSKIYIPDGKDDYGYNAFDSIIIEEDKIFSSDSTTSYESLFGWNNNLESFWFNADSFIFSGIEPESVENGTYWYDIDNNIIKYRENDTWIIRKDSFPLGRFIRESGIPVKITQIFNGIGYMGSTIFALPGIKGLIPCGKTKKGLLSNKSFTTNKILMTTNNDLTDGQNIILNDSSIEYSENAEYNSFNNKIYVDGQPNEYVMIAGKVYFSEGKISSFTQKTQFKVVDYSELPEIIYWD